MINFLSIFPSAQAAVQHSQSAAHPTGFLSVLPTLVLVAAMIYFLIIRPQIKQEKQQTELVSSMNVGDEIIFAGGVMGTVATIFDEHFTVRTNDTNELIIQKSALNGILPKGTIKGLSKNSTVKTKKKAKAKIKPQLTS